MKKIILVWMIVFVSLISSVSAIEFTRCSNDSTLYYEGGIDHFENVLNTDFWDNVDGTFGYQTSWKDDGDYSLTAAFNTANLLQNTFTTNLDTANNEYLLQTTFEAQGSNGHTFSIKTNAGTVIMEVSLSAGTGYYGTRCGSTYITSGIAVNIGDVYDFKIVANSSGTYGYLNDTVLRTCAASTVINKVELDMNDQSQSYVHHLDTFFIVENSTDLTCPPAILPDVVTLLTPEDNSGQNVAFNFSYNINVDNQNCSLWANFSGVFAKNHTNYTINALDNPHMFDVPPDLPDGDYLWNVVCNDTYSSVSNYTFTIDIVTPTITINTNNFFNTTNESTITNYDAVLPLIVNVTVADSLSGIYAFEFNITAFDGTNLYFNKTEGLGNLPIYNFNDTVDYSGWTPNQNVTIDVWASDPHTKYKINKYKVTKGSDLRYDTTEGNYIRIYSDEFVSMDTTYETNKYSFDVEFLSKGVKNRKLYVQSDNPIKYISDDKYTAWFVIMNGREGNWIDFNGFDGETKVKKITDYLYEITFIDMPNKIKFKSVGGLNVNHETYLWYYPASPTIASVELTTNIGYNPAIVENQMIANVNGSSGTYAGLIYEYIWYKNDAIYSSNYTIGNVNDVITNVDNQPSNTAAISDAWIFSVRSNSSGIVSSYTNSSTLNFIDWNLTSCDSGLVALNYTGRFESNQSNVNISSSGSITYSVNGYTNDKIIYPSIVNNAHFQYCISPSWVDFDLDYDLNYNEFGSSIIRSRSDTAVLINNVSLVVPLYVISPTYAGFIRFRVVDSSEQTVSGATVIAVRDIAGVDYTVQSGVSDDAGMVNLYLDTTETHTITASKTGYGSASVSIIPNAEEITTIRLPGSSSTVQTVIGSGVHYWFMPTQIDLSYNTNYTFTFNMTSEFLNITTCALSLYNNETLVFGTTGTYNNTHCGATIVWNTSNYTMLHTDATYGLNGTNYDVQYYYYPTDWEAGEYSMKVMLDDIKNFAGAGFDYRTMMLISFFIIFMIVALVSWKFAAMVNPESVLILQWALVLLFSIAGWLSIPVSAFQFPVIGGYNIIGQYILLIFDSMLTAAYLVWRHN